jgi:DNA repair photolyase
VPLGVRQPDQASSLPVPANPAPTGLPRRLLARFDHFPIPRYNTLMARRVEFVPYRPRTILNKHKRPDHWFWTRYTAYPYKGCQHRCLFCYCRERKYCPFDDLDDFGYVIQIKENAPELLRRALSRAPVDVVGTGDYQPAERKFGLSRRMLEVCLDLGFPVFVLERSPLVVRDLDLLQAIDDKAVAMVGFSIISTPDSPHDQRVRQMECLAPPSEERFAAMDKLARAGILTGTCMMPILPRLCDDDANLQSVVKWTAAHGGQFVLAGDLTMADQQRDFFLGILDERFPDLAAHYRSLYPVGSYGPVRSNWHKIALRLRELSEQHGIRDRMPRSIIPGDKRALNKQVVEALANQVYWMELNREHSRRVWAYRKAAWAIEDTEQDLGLIYRAMGRKGLESIENVGPRLARVVENLLEEVSANSEGCGRQGHPG